MIEQCCVCRRVKIGEEFPNAIWVDSKIMGFLLPNDITHGYCPECYKVALSEIIISGEKK